MKLNLKTLTLIFAGLVLFSSCEDWKAYEPEQLPGNHMANEWYVTYKVGGVDIYNFGYSTIITSTTAAADGENLIVTDQGHFWDYLVKSPMNADAKTFGISAAGDSLTNLVDGYDIKIRVTNGKVIAGGGTSKTGVKVDSIYMEIEFADDPGTIYEVGGHGRTGFEEDDY
ncbi:MAG: hypothetical protein ACI8ZN_000606 [Bacteroidia bacterium]|jgi:hypothetical protein